MHPRICSWASVALALLAVAPGRAAETDPDLAYAEQTLREGKVGTDATSLLEFFRRRTVAETDRVKLAALVRQLGHDEFERRQQASAKLRRAGRPALALLRRALADKDPEIARRAERLVAVIDRVSELPLAEAAARVLAHRKPAGAAKVLLAYLPQANDEGLEEALLLTLKAVGSVGGKADPALVAALSAKQPLLRGAAAIALATVAAQRPAVRRLLADKDDAVRLRAARALFGAADKAAVPALIALVGRGPQEGAWQAEELLCRLAGDQEPPAVLDAADAAARRKAATAWEKWWKANGDKIDLAKVNRHKALRGFTLVCEAHMPGGRGRVYSCGRDGKPRWQLPVYNPIDAQVLPGKRVLVANCNGNEVVEMDRKGKVLWSYKVNYPVVARRQPNGNTFIATYNSLLEVTPKGKQVFLYPKSNYIYCAVKKRNGHIVYIHTSGRVIELDAKGKEVRNVPVLGGYGWGGLDLLPNGHFLVAQSNANQVTELDARGKVVWKYNTPSPSYAMRLPNGNTLISSTARQFLEVDRKGKVVQKHATQGILFRLRKY
jgi:HEAT repeat protein